MKLGCRLNQWGIAVGAPRPLASVSLDSIEVRVMHDDVEVAAGTSSLDVLDDPVATVLGLARFLARFGLTLRPGDHVITGSLTPAQALTPGTWRADFTCLGTVELVVTGVL